MLRLSTFVVCFVSAVCFAEEDKIEEPKKEVAAEELEKMTAVVERKDPKACWDFLVSVDKGSFAFFAGQADLKKCWMDYAKQVITEADSTVSMMTFFGQYLINCAGDEACIEQGKTWTQARIAELRDNAKIIADTKRSFYAAINKNDTETAAEKLNSCYQADGGKECDKMQAVYDAKAEKIAQENKRREEAEAARQARAEAAEKERAEKEEKAVKAKIKAWHAKYLPNALRFAKQKVMDDLYTPDRVKWVSLNEIVGIGEDYIFHAVYDALNAYGVYIRNSSCVYIAIDADNPNELARSARQDCPRDRKGAARVVLETFKNEQERRESEDAE